MPTPIHPSENAPADNAPANTAHADPASEAADIRAGLEAAQAADVSDEARAAECWCSTRVYVDYLDGATCCPRHGDTADAREYRGTFLCECGLEEVAAHAHTVTHGAHAFRLCRVCSTCASCRRRAELVDGEVCEACDDARTEAAEARAREGEWAAANPEATYAPPPRF